MHTNNHNPNNNHMDIFNDKNKQKIKYNTLKFGVVGDKFVGTLTDNSRTMINDLSAKKELQTVFEFIALEGSVHLIDNKVVDKEATVMVKGDKWSFITGKPQLLDVLKKAQKGQFVGLVFAESKKAEKKGFNDSKIIEVYLGDMDKNYKEDTGIDM